MPTDANGGIEAEWGRICRRLEATGLKALRNRGVERDREKAEALRLIVREFRSAAEKYLEASEPAFPVVVRADETGSGQLAAPNIDNWYLYIPLSAAHSHRITGNLATVFDAIFAPHDDNFGNFRELYGRDMEVAANGDYELFLGRPHRNGNWMPLAEGVSFITIRFYYYDWDRHSPPPIRGERIGSLGKAPEPVMPRPLAARLDRAFDYVDSVPYSFSGLIEGWVKDLPAATRRRRRQGPASRRASRSWGTELARCGGSAARVLLLPLDLGEGRPGAGGAKGQACRRPQGAAARYAGVRRRTAQGADRGSAHASRQAFPLLSRR